MGILSASQTIKNARLQAGLSQNQLSEGICSAIALSNFETGKYGISPSTFSALMSKLGKPLEVYPLFESMNDHECYIHLSSAKHYIDHGKIEPAFSELEQTAAKKFNSNKFYYQTWLSLYSYILIFDEEQDPDRMIASLKEAVKLAQPDLDLSNLQPSCYNITEKKLILFIALFELLKKGNKLICSSILDQLKNHCEDDPDAHLLYAFIQSLYLYFIKDRKNTFRSSKQLQILSLKTGIHTFLIPAVFFMGVSGSNKKVDGIYASLETADAYFPFWADFLRKKYDLSDADIPAHLKQPKNLPEFHPLSLDMPEGMTDGFFDIYKKNVVTLGNIILSSRKDQRLSQQTLCNGLCNKSTLSRFENGSLNPGIPVTQYLLERLGFTNEFVFYGDRNEAEFYRIKEILTGHYKMDREHYRQYTVQLEPLSETDPLIRQQYFLFMTQLTENKDEIISLCKKALNITLPGFDISNISSYRLSWAEMSLVTVMVNAIAFSENHFDAPYYFQKIYEYSTQNDFGLLWKKNHLAHTLSKYVRYLGENRMYNILLARMEQWDFSSCSFHPGNMLNINYYLSQAYNFAADKEKAEEYRHLTSSLAIVLNDARAMKHLAEKDG